MTDALTDTWVEPSSPIAAPMLPDTSSDRYIYEPLALDDLNAPGPSRRERRTQSRRTRRTRRRSRRVAAVAVALGVALCIAAAFAIGWNRGATARARSDRTAAERARADARQADVTKLQADIAVLQRFKINVQEQCSAAMTAAADTRAGWEEFSAQLAIVIENVNRFVPTKTTQQDLEQLDASTARVQDAIQSRRYASCNELLSAK